MLGLQWFEAISFGMGSGNIITLTPKCKEISPKAVRNYEVFVPLVRCYLLSYPKVGSGWRNLPNRRVMRPSAYLSTDAFSQFTGVTRENQGNYALRGNHNKQGPFSESGARIWGAQVKG
jgi:hypothetical protein